ncbi:WD40 repeat domain-containing protein [Paludisphaera sp.]|uniref:WD40 repeat domain-containing protein n=1 Tax=Paludisphaera sp. TaxID=2017432 RepID=UPI00301C9113
MQREVDGDFDGWTLQGEGSRVEARGVRLPIFTLRGLLVFVAVLAVGAAMVGEEPEAGEEGKGGTRLAGHSGLIDSLRFSSEGGTLLSSGWDRTVRLWDLEGPGGELGRELARLTFDSEVFASAISPDGRVVAVAGNDGLALWHWERGEVTRPKHRSIGVSRALAFSPDGSLLAVGGYDHGVHLVDVATSRVEADFMGHRDVIRKLAFTADGSRLFSLGYDGRLKAWDVASRRETDAPAGHDDELPVLSFAVSPDGLSLALSRVGADDGGIEIRDVTDGSLRAVCRGARGSGEVHALAFSRDGEVLASCGSDLGARFWNPATGRPSGILEGSRGWVRTLDFSADGRWLATSSAPDEVRLWRVELPRRPAAPATATTLGESSREAEAA